MQNKYAYAYLDISKPLVEWEVAIGRVRSICDRTEPCLSPFFIEKLAKSNDSGRERQKLINELKLERIRRQHYPECVSRLTGTFFFDDPQTAEFAIRDVWRWPFDSAQVSRIAFSSTNATRVDTNWITNHISNDTRDEAWMHEYWRGATCGSSPIYELIMSGVGRVDNPTLQGRAYTGILQRSPGASKLLALSAAAFFSGHIEVGSVTWSLVTHRKYLRASLHIDMNAFKSGSDVDFKRCLMFARDAGARFPYVETDDYLLPQASDRFSWKMTDALQAELSGLWDLANVPS